MGNCIEKSNNSPQTEIIKKPFDEEENKSDKEKSGNMRIKIVLTKEELEWLMVQLENKGGKKVEDVLDEIQRNREKSQVAWKPSLDSIIESPEVPEAMDR
ncbi:hypothetical protein PHJA_002915500 [Phtheirospermum japonicum]|uniref:Uncharacterized protein n=1 Tax=Phtheirospermum japonicum TaxID=374723 RepID=A0A830DHE0_9LAMI|nr:hypothetical protein PHJA_002915500 [Phtheirospermum japonicum]